MDNEAPVIVAVVATIATTFGFTVRQILTSIRAHRQLRLQADTINRIVERLGASPELVTWLNSGSAKGLLETAVEQQNPLGRIMNAMQIGAVLTIFGLAFFVIRIFSPHLEPVVIGTLLTALGLGFLLSAFAAYTMSKAHGLLPEIKHPQ